MLQNSRKTLGFKKNMVYKIPPGGEVNHIQPVAYKLWWPFCYVGSKIVSEYDQEIPQSQTADNPVVLGGRAAQPSQDTRKTN